MENRWLILLVAVGVSTASYAALLTWRAASVLGSYENFIRKCFASIGLTPPSYFGTIPYAGAVLCFYPFALRLGWRRTAIWIALIGVGTALSPVWPTYWDQFGIVFVPCMAMIGRRTRPWMALPASVAFVVAAQLAGMKYGYTVIVACASLPYAAILIFGTKLIPRKSMPASPAG